MWRILIAAFCFAAFSIGGIALSFLLFPLFRLLPGGAAARERRARLVVRRSFGALLWTLQALRMLRIETRNLAALENSGAVLVLANHPSYLDIVVLISHIRDAVCVVKSKVWSNPFFGGVVRAAGYIRNDEPEHVIANCVARLAGGLPLVMFPEGTRSAPGEPLHFVRGAARIALASGVPILPVVLRCEPALLPRGAKWYQMPAGSFRIIVEVLPCTDASALLAKEAGSPRRLTQALERFFTDQLACDERPAT